MPASYASDGLVLGLTSSKVGFDYSGVSYLPDSAIAASAARQTTDTSADNAEVDGILQSDAIIETEVRAGLWDSAKYQLFLVNYDDLSMGSVIVSAGRLGVVTLNDGSFKFELLSWRNLLKQNVQIATSQTCRVRVLGDSQCKVSLSGRVHSVTASALSDDWLTVTTNDTQASGYYVYGVAEGTSGANSNVQRQIVSNSSGSIVLAEPFPSVISSGDTFSLTQGCDRNWLTCKNVFSNTINFHGEPFVPGNDNALQVGYGN